MRKKKAGQESAKPAENPPDMLSPGALPAAHFDRNKIPAISGTRY